MKIAILLLCHKNPNQINLLIKTMYNESIDFFIHVDKKANFKDIIKTNNHVFILEDDLRIDVRWASFSQIKATRNLIKSATSHGTYDYYWLCSGQDFPIKSVKQIIRFFENNGKDVNYLNLFISKNNQSSYSNKYDKRNDIYYPSIILDRKNIKRCLRRIYVGITGGYNNTYQWAKTKLENVDFFFGSQWWCLNRKTIMWILNYENYHKEYIDYYKHCSTPDESYFHTLVMNSPFANQRKNYLHYIVWEENSNSPKILKMNDIYEICNSEFLMARKFDEFENSNILFYLINYVSEVGEFNV